MAMKLPRIKLGTLVLCAILALAAIWIAHRAWPVIRMLLG